jgi:hypothetical protein
MINLNSKNKNRKTLLAQMMARENVKVVFNPMVETGMFFPKDRILVLPVFKEGITENLIDLLIAHESAHGLYTPHNYSEQVEKFAKLNRIGAGFAGNLINIVEDIRINKLVQNEYPGTRRDFIAGYRDRYERGDYGTKDPDKINKLPFTDRLNIAFKAGHVVDVKFTEEEQFWVEQLKSLEIWDDVLKISKDIVEFIKRKNAASKEDDGGKKAVSNETEKKPTKKQLVMSSKQGGLGGKGDDQEDNTSDPEPSTPSEGPDWKDIDLDAEIMTVESEKFFDKSLRIKSNDQATPIYAPKAIGHIQQSYKSLIKNENVIENTVNDGFAKFWKEINKHVDFMINHFNMKKAARDYARLVMKKTGVLDTGRLAYYKTSEDVFKKNGIKKEGKNHGFVYLLDCSGSMSGMMANTRKQVIMLALFARRLGVPFKVITFTDAGYYNAHDNYDRNDLYRMNSQVLVNKVGITKTFSAACSLGLMFDNEMTDMEFRKMARRWFGISGHLTVFEKADGGTPLNTAMLYTFPIVRNMVKKYNIDIVNFINITDGGAGDCFSAPMLIDSDFANISVNSSNGYLI